MLKWGIIGCGNIAGSFSRDLALVDGHRLQAVASRSEGKAKAFACEHGAVSAYGSYQAICQDPEVDIIYLATPHSNHKEYGIMVMDYGKHLLCEKALAVSLSEVEDMIEAAKRNNVFFMEAMWARFNPSIREVKRRVLAGDIGAVTYINADFCFYKEFDPTHRLFDPERAGGALLDVGVYPLFLSYFILGKPRQIVSTALIHSNGVDLQTSILLRYDSAHAILSCGFLNTARMEGRVNGTKGSLHLHPRWHETQGYSTYIDKVTTDYALPTRGAGYTYEILECAECIATGRKESMRWSHEDSRQLITMCDEIRQQCGIKYPFE